MNNILVKFKDDSLTDQIGISGFRILSIFEWTKIVDKIIITKFPHWYYVDNSIVRYDSAEEFLNKFTVLGIVNSHEAHLRYYFPDGKFGQFPEFDK